MLIRRWSTHGSRVGWFGVWIDQRSGQLDARVDRLIDRFIGVWHLGECALGWIDGGSVCVCVCVCVGS